MKLYHVTSRSALESIKASGSLQAPSYWSSLEEMAGYYSEVISDEGETPVTLTVELSLLDEACLEPDLPSIEEPIMTLVREHHGWPKYCGEDTVWDEWKKTGRSWRDSLVLVGSVRCRAEIPFESMKVEGGVVYEPFMKL